MASSNREQIPRLDLLLLAAGLIAAALFIVAKVVDDYTLRMVSKPVPVLAMIFWLLRSSRTTPARLVAAGLVASLAGDMLLEHGDSLFLHGVAAFFAAHLLYIGAFTLETRAPRPLLLLIFAVYVVGLMAVLWPGLGDMRIPVLAYAIAICVMLWRAAARIGSSAAARSLHIIGALGAISFAISDSLIALSRFALDARGIGMSFAIMALYWLGQLGITWSVAKRPGSE